jgi:hypothetical protein
MDKRLDEIFAKYAGKPARDPERLSCDICETTYQLTQEIEALGYAARLTWDGAMLTMDFNRNRVNIELAQVGAGPQKKYVVTGDYRFG